MNKTQRDSLERFCKTSDAEVVSTISHGDKTLATLATYLSGSLILLDVTWINYRWCVYGVSIQWS